MTTAAQMPYARGDAEKVGPRTFRKTVLKFGSIPYKGRTLTYDRDYGTKLVDNFKAGAFGQVPFVLVDGDNRHTNDPERFRGEVKGLELTADGVDATVELTAEGAEIVDRNPRLGVSPRIVEDAEHVPHLPAIQHVAGTFDPRGRDLGDWKRVADLAGVYSADTVDLTATEYMADSTSTSEPLTGAELAALAAADPAAVRALIPEADAGSDTSTTALPAQSPAAEPRSLLDRFRGRGAPPSPESHGPSIPLTPTDPETVAAFRAAEVDDTLSAEDRQALSDLLGDEATDADREPVALSAEDRRVIELSASRAEAAESRADTVAAAMRAEQIDRERAECVRLGVPKKIFDLAAPFLGADAVVELSGGEEHDASAAMRQILEEHKGFLDMSGPRGSLVAIDDDEERREQAEAATRGWV